MMKMIIMVIDHRDNIMMIMTLMVKMMCDGDNDNDVNDDYHHYYQW